MSAELVAFSLVLDATKNTPAERREAARRILVVAQQALIGAGDVQMADFEIELAELLSLARQLIEEPRK